MADVTIRLVSNPKTGKREIYIDYHSDDDALPFEHEKEHRTFVEKFLGKGVLDADSMGQIHVGRVAPQAAPSSSLTQEDAQAGQEGLAQNHGQG